MQNESKQARLSNLQQIKKIKNSEKITKAKKYTESPTA
jgi:hypothetical protein